MKTIILCGGGTAGHVMPNVALLPYLKKFKVIYLGCKGAIEEELCKQNGIEFHPIEVVKFSRTNLLKNVKIPISLPICVKKCEKLLRSLNPSVVFSKGGYASLPVTISAKRLGIPYVIHESDLSMGVANKLVRKDASIVMTNFESTYTAKNAITTGIPLRDNLFTPLHRTKILESLNLPDKKTILVTGGSMGAKSLNDFIISCLDQLTKNYNVIHLTGKGKGSNVVKEGYLPIEFSQNIGQLYKCADVVVSRAGATAISEIRALGKKAILIPLSKKASRGDQIKNAKYVECDTIKVFEEDCLDKIRFLKTVDELMRKPAKTAIKSGISNQEIANILYNISL